MPTTSRWGLRYPTLNDSPDVPLWIQRLATDLDGVAMDDQGPFASRPTSTAQSPGKRGRYYYATDREILYRDTGTGWRIVAAWTMRASGRLDETISPSYGWVDSGGGNTNGVGTTARPSLTVPFAGTYDVTLGFHVNTPHNDDMWAGMSISASDVDGVGVRVAGALNAPGAFHTSDRVGQAPESAGRTFRRTFEAGQVVQLGVRCAVRGQYSYGAVSVHDATLTLEPVA